MFPNTALVTATLAMGKALDSAAIEILGTVLSAGLVLVWIYVFSMMLRALLVRRLLWPGRADGAEVSLRTWVREQIPTINVHAA